MCFSKFRIKRMQPFFLVFKCIWGYYFWNPITLLKNRVNTIARGRELTGRSVLAKNHEFSTRSTYRIDRTAKLHVITQKNSLTCRAYVTYILHENTDRYAFDIKLFVIFAWFIVAHQCCPVTLWSWNFHPESLRYVMTISTARYSARDFQ